MFVYVFIGALINCSSHMSVFEWNSNTVDNILLQGDSKYRNSAFESGVIPRERYYFILLIRKAAKIVPYDISFKGGFPFSGKCRAIDFFRSLSFELQ